MEHLHSQLEAALIDNQELKSRTRPPTQNLFNYSFSLSFPSVKLQSMESEEAAAAKTKKFIKC